MSNPITGGCYCGAVRYESSKPSPQSGTCHCRMCQRWTGSPCATGVFFEKDGFTFTKGEPRTFLTSPILERQFCGECGTSIGHRYIIGDFTETQIIFIGTLDNPETFDGPSWYFGAESHLPNWYTLKDDVPKVRADTDENILAAFATAEKISGG